MKAIALAVLMFAFALADPLRRQHRSRKKQSTERKGKPYTRFNASPLHFFAFQVEVAAPH